MSQGASGKMKKTRPRRAGLSDQQTRNYETAASKPRTRNDEMNDPRNDRQNIKGALAFGKWFPAHHVRNRLCIKKMKNIRKGFGF